MISKNSQIKKTYLKTNSPPLWYLLSPPPSVPFPPILRFWRREEKGGETRRVSSWSNPRQAASEMQCSLRVWVPLYPSFSLGGATHGQSWRREDVRFLFNLYEVGHRMEGFGWSRRQRYPSGITCLGLSNLSFSEAFHSLAGFGEKEVLDGGGTS